MAVPTVTNIYPATAHTSGEAIVRILGGDFRVAAGRSVDVLFGGASALAVWPVNHALLYARVPPSPLSADAAAGAVDVAVRNLDADGVPLPGEETVLALGFTYRSLDLTLDSSLVRVVRQFIRELKRQVFRNVTVGPAHSDYDASTGDALHLTEVQSLPSLILIGPELEEGSQPELNESLPAFQRQVMRRQPRYYDLRFQIFGAADKLITLLNLQSALIVYVQRNPYLMVDRDDQNPALGQVCFELSFESNGAPAINAGGDDSNVRTFAAQAVIRRVPIEGLAGFDEEGAGAVMITERVADAVTWALAQIALE